MHRRDFLRLMGALAGSAALSACAPVYRWASGVPADLAAPADLPPLSPNDLAALHRLTFGPTLAERVRVAEIGLSAWVEEQLDPAHLPDPAAERLVRRFGTLTMAAHELHGWSDKLFDDEDRITVPTELRLATLTRQVYSRRQLFEVLVDFWSDHFNISLDKGDCYYLKTVDDRNVVRPHALGSFRDLLHASAHSPAMLVYLDQHVSTAAHPNENYAREVLELHTLGVEAGYTQRDVMELARCFTGWTVKERFWRGDFTFDPAQHDPGPKTVLGLALAPAGQAEAEHVLDMLAAHPATATRLAAKLCQRLLGTTPPALVHAAARAFQTTQGNLRALTRVIALDGLGAGTFAPKFKRPGHFVVSALRQLHAAADDLRPALTTLERLGHLPFAWSTPDGYPDQNAAWQANLLPRWRFAAALARDELPGLRVPWDTLPTHDSLTHLSHWLLGAPLPTPVHAALAEAVRAAPSDQTPRLLAAGLLASPQFQWI